MKNASLSILLFCIGILACAVKKEVSLSPEKKDGYISKTTKAINGTYPDDIPVYKKALVIEVAERLIEAQGNPSLKQPNIKIEATTWNAAWMDKNEIGIEEKAFDLCMTFGKDSVNCIAALLGHELTHYYQRDHTDDNFRFDYLNVKTLQKGEKKKIRKSIDAQKEATADYLGGFLAYSAGYKPFGILEELLPKLYESYDLEEEMEGYPALAERIKNAKKSSEHAQVLANVFEMANGLVALERYEEAIDYYEYILGENFTSREIHNNIGVCYFMMGLADCDDQAKKYGFPIEIDGEGRLLYGTKGSHAQTEVAKKNLKEAIEKFQTAYTLDKTYATGLLNEACAYTLLNKDYEEAMYLVKKAKKIARENNQQKVLADCQILNGIHAALLDKKEEATENFNTAASTGNLLAKYNNDILTEGKPVYVSLLEGGIPTEFSGKEIIGRKDLDKLLSAFEEDESIPINNASFKISKITDARLLLHLTNNYVLFQLPDADYKGATTKGIQIGSSQKEILEKYGQPNRLVPQRKRAVLVYEKPRIIFSLLDGKVENWMIYRMKKRKQ